MPQTPADGRVSAAFLPACRMSDCTVFYNPRCSKCRALLDLLAARGLQPQLVDYLEQPPDAATLRQLLQRLGDEGDALLRRDEAELATLGLSADISGEDLIEALLRHPQLMQRPVVVCAERALIARPPERALELF